MKTVTFVPSACRGESPTLTGELVLRVPTFSEKMRYMKDMGVDFSNKAELESLGVGRNLELISKLVDLSAAHYVSVSLKKLNGEEIKSYEAMQDEEECHPVLSEIGGMLIGGFKLGNG